MAASFAHREQGKYAGGRGFADIDMHQRRKQINKQIFIRRVEDKPATANGRWVCFAPTDTHRRGTGGGYQGFAIDWLDLPIGGKDEWSDRANQKESPLPS